MKIPKPFKKTPQPRNISLDNLNALEIISEQLDALIKIKLKRYKIVNIVSGEIKLCDDL